MESRKDQSSSDDESLGTAIRNLLISNFKAVMSNFCSFCYCLALLKKQMSKPAKIVRKAFKSKTLVFE